jgi:hypothetical protein
MVHMRSRANLSFDTPRESPRRGFLVHRRALKLSILAAVFKPDTRSIEQSAESNLDNPSGLHLPKR